MIIRVWKNKITFWLMLAVITFWGLTNAWPPSWFLSVDSLIVHNSISRQDIYMTVDREIKRPFVAHWDVLVRKVDSKGSQVVCSASGGGDYTPDAKLPHPLTLSWWTNGACESLPVGTYYISTVWVIEGGGLPDKIIKVESNVFDVEEVNDGR